jgi:hypothetical protein
MQSESKMAKQKAAFEEKLRQQESNNRMIISANANISAEIKSLQSSNDELRKHARESEQNNHLMRSELRQLQSRFGVATDFIANSLTSTDDTKQSVLRVLDGASHHHHHVLVQTSVKSHKSHGDSDEEAEADDDDDDDSEDSSVDKDTSDDNDDHGDDDSDDDDSQNDNITSFLALSVEVRRASVASASKVATIDTSMVELESALPVTDAVRVLTATPSNPEDLLGGLVRDVANLAQQEKQSEKTLKELFIHDFRAEAKRGTALIAQQKDLRATQTSLLALRAKLKRAESHLEATGMKLQAKLHGLGQYLQKLAHLAMAPQGEVKNLLDNLPKAVTLKDKLI